MPIAHIIASYIMGYGPVCGHMTELSGCENLGPGKDF